MDKDEKGQMIYLRSCEESLAGQVFLQLPHTVSSFNSWNCHVLHGEIYEDIFLPIGRDGKFTEFEDLRTKLRKKLVT